MSKKNNRKNMIAWLAPRYVTASNGIYGEPGLRCRCGGEARVHIYRFERGQHAKKKCFYIECVAFCGLVTNWHESFETAALAFLQRKSVKLGTSKTSEEMVTSVIKRCA